MNAMTRFDYKIMGRLVYIHTDHHNLLIMYDAQGVSWSITQFTMNTLMIWAINLSAFKYVVGHIKGEDNHWEDMLL